jgi:hypothetical protein
MKPTYTHLLAFIVAALFGALLLIGMTSCDNAKRAIKAHNKAERLGYIYKCEPTTITLRDTIKGKDGKDSIIEVLVKVPCPKVEPPKTRYEIRHMAKRERDSMKHVEEMLQLEIKRLKAVKQIKQVEKKIVQSETKGKKFDSKGEWSRLVWAIVFGIVALGLLFLLIKWVKSWIK